MKILLRRQRASIVVAIVLSCPSAALACDCAPLDLPGRLAAADLVVVARVTSFTPLRIVNASPVETFKGRSPPSVTIRTGESDCDLFLPPENPKVGAEYLLYLHRSGGEFTASRCLAP
ncbi:MAG TPA: hypothetical protein VHP55_08605, partial [Usitatibacter sp.]|nr:hypothetical protein [Usitatibacter sp.]